MKKIIIGILSTTCVFYGSSHIIPPSTKKSNLPQEMINQKAPGFHLKDMNGKIVSLEDYKGKVLVLDFWATWCAPCKQSFPILKSVMDQYKNDPNVAFLFIDTKEKNDNYPQLVRDLMEQKKYQFHVAFDEKGNDGNMDVTFKKYKMIGVPSKYFIDSKGVIRYVSLGFDTKLSPDQAVHEVEKTLEMTKNFYKN
jgi:thiol-disulfide isomerase/thioredoxin